MENQTGFDLNIAVENWRKELAAQPHCTADKLRELETHLRDTFAGMKKLGLRDDEAFWVASRRIGRPEQLNQEFAKNERLRPAFVHRLLLISSVTALLAWLFSHTVLSTLVLNSMAGMIGSGMMGQGSFIGHWNNYLLDTSQEIFWVSLGLTACFSLLKFRRRFTVMVLSLFFGLCLVQALVYTEGYQRWVRTAISQGIVVKEQGGKIVHPDWIGQFWHAFSNWIYFSDQMWFCILVLLIAALLSEKQTHSPSIRYRRD